MLSVEVTTSDRLAGLQQFTGGCVDVNRLFGRPYFQLHIDVRDSVGLNFNAGVCQGFEALGLDSEVVDREVDGVQTIQSRVVCRRGANLIRRGVL